MSKLDDTISNVAYILDTLMAYRNITKHGNCNECQKKLQCAYVPQPGAAVRWNCPFFIRIGDTGNIPSAQPEPLSDAYMKAVWTWLLNYQIRVAELKGRYPAYEVLSWVLNDWKKEHERKEDNADVDH